MAACAVGLVPTAFGWIAARERLQLDQSPGAAAASGPRPWGVWVVARLALLTAVAALLLPSEPPPHPHSGQGAAAPTPGNRGRALAGAGGPMDLRNRGTLDSQPMLSVPSDSPQLWQAGWYDAYDGGSWAYSDVRSPKFAFVPLRPASTLPRGAGLTTSTVTPLSPLPFAYAPGPLVAIAGEGGATYDLGTGSLGVTGIDRPLASYSVTWADEATGPVTTLAAQPAVTDQRWRALPAELPGRVLGLARTVTAGLTTTQAKVAAVAHYLRTHEKYSLDSPVPAPGVDAVDAFLFTDHVGFCEQFASAETVMLRALGIPARVATGFGGPGAAGADGSRVYRNQDAHAWVQVGYPGGHWVSSDPTAGSQKATTSHGGLVAWLKRLWKSLTGTAAARRWLAVGLVLLALVAWRVALWLRRRRQASQDGAAVERETEAGRAYQRLLDRLAEQDRPRRPTETVRDLLVRLGAHPVETVARALETEWYGRTAERPRQLVAQVVAILDGLATEPPGLAP